MMTLSKRQLAALVLAAIVAGCWMSLPRVPTPADTDRPVLRAIVKLAKNFLWVALLAEGPPPEPEPAQYVRTHVGEDGYQTLDHGRGW